VHALTATDHVARDRRFCDQIRDAASSATRNIAEGFGRYRHKEFANLLSIAKGSLHEVADCLSGGVARKYWSTDTIAKPARLCDRAIRASAALIRWLRTHPDPPDAEEPN
jgi:four helix bundle protein